MNLRLVVAALRVSLILIMLLPACKGMGQVEQPDSVQAFDQANVSATDLQRIQGIQVQGREADHLPRTIANTLLFLPRTTLSGFLYATGRSAYVVSDPDFIDRVESYLYFYQRTFGWYPTANIVSDSRPSYGIGLFYKKSEFKTTLSGYRTSAIKWNSTLKLVYERDVSSARLETMLEGMARGDDDRLFYGFGNDPRFSEFRMVPGEVPGVFHQRLNRISWSGRIRTAGLTTWQYLGFWQERTKEDGTGGEKLGNIFDLASLAGFDLPRTQLYQEASAIFDTRQFQDEISPGLRLEGYSGYSNGLSDLQPDFLRYGVDLFYAFPVLLRNRILVPRIQVNGLSMLNGRWDDLPIMDYPRHALFRGASGRHHLRNAPVVAVSSLEYQWPLTRLVGGSLFVDLLTAGDNPSQFTLKEAPVAYGTGIAYQTKDQSIARLLVATGSEGLRLKLVLGFSLYNDVRSDWD